MPPKIGEPIVLQTNSEWAQSIQSQLNLSNTTYSAGSPQVGVGFIAPASGQVLLLVGGGMRNNTGASNDRLAMTPEVRVGSASGSVVLAANDTNLLQYGVLSAGTSQGYHYESRMALLTGLTPGTSYFARIMHRVVPSGGSPSSTADITVRDMGVIPTPIAPGASVGEHIRPIPVSTFAQSDESQLNQTNIDPDYIAGNPEVAVRFVAPPSGRTLLIVGGSGRDNTSTSRVFLLPQVYEGDSFGPPLFTNLSQSFVRRGFATSGQAFNYKYGSRATILTGLKPGSSYYGRVMHTVESGTTADVGVREIMTVPV